MDYTPHQTQYLQSINQSHFKYGPKPASFCLLTFFSQYNDKFDHKSVDCVLGI